MQSCGEDVSIATVAGRWRAFERVEVDAAVHHACRSVRVRVAAVAGETGTNAIFANFAPITVNTAPRGGAGPGDLLMTGFIDERHMSISGHSAKMTFAGRSKGQDAVDCSHDHPTGRFENKTVLDIAKAIDIYGIGFTSAAQLEPIPEYHLVPGASVFREVERLCRDEALSLFGQADGSIALWNADAALQRQAGALVEGRNIIEATAEHNSSNRHSHKHVRGHQARGTGRAVHLIAVTARDAGVPRTRHHVYIHDGGIDKRRAGNRANNHRDRSAGHGLHATIHVKGWRDEAGTLWTPGYRVWVQSPFLDIAQDMLIEKVGYVQDHQHGTDATLHLVDPRAYAGKGGRSNSGAEWGIEGEDAS